MDTGMTEQEAISLDKTLANVSLETLSSEVMKAVKNTHGREKAYVQELVNRTTQAYLDHLDKFLAAYTHGICLDSDKFNYFGWYPISQLCHADNWDRPILFHFNYADGDPRVEFDPEKHATGYPLDFTLYHARGGYDVLAVQGYGDEWYIGSNRHLLKEGVSIKLDVSKATRFTLFSDNISQLTREGIVENNRRLKAQVTGLKEKLEAQNIALDALGSVWCMGPCDGGQFRSTEPSEITDAMLVRLIGEVSRLLDRGPNQTKMQKKFEYYERVKDRTLRRVRKHGLEKVIAENKSKLEACNTASNLTLETHEVTHCAPYIRYGTQDSEKSFAVNDGLMYLLDKHVVVMKPADDGKPSIWLSIVNLPGYYSGDIELSYSDIQAVYDASQTKYGLTVWVAERTNKKPSLGTFYVGEMKELGLWKPEWDYPSK